MMITGFGLPGCDFLRKIAELGNEAEFLRGVLDRYVRSRTKEQREAQEREELLARRNSVRSAVHSARVCGEHALIAVLSPIQAMPAIVVDQLMEEGASLQRSSAVVGTSYMHELPLS
jgi:hypothetical protein